MTGRAPALLMRALTGHLPHGHHACFFCGTACGEDHPRKQFLKDTFTDFSACAALDSHHVCTGCTLAMNEKMDMPGKDKPQKVRNYSWVITDISATPYTKGQIPELRAICLVPPKPPYSIILATSGQKQLIFKAMVQSDRNSASACLEGETINWLPGELNDRLDIAGRISAVTGKTSITEAPTISMAIQLSDALGDEGIELYETWKDCWTQPLSRLAAFLAPSKKENA